MTTFYPPYHFGGDATYVRSLSRALVEKGHEVEVVHCEDAWRTVSHSQAPAEVMSDDAIGVHRLKSRFGILSSVITQQTGRPGLKHAALKKILDRSFDVVHFHNISLVGGPAVLRLSKAPVTLYSLHEHWLLCPTHIFWKNRTHACDVKQCLRCSLRSGIPPQLWRYTGLIRRSLAGVDAMLAPSDFTARKHEEAGIGQNIQVLPLFSTLDPGEPPDFSPAQNPKFLYVGRVTASKGLLPLLETFARLGEADLQVVGDGEMLPRLQQDFASAKNIAFLGSVRQSELVRLYQRATALILPSLAPETFGLTVAEAFACATPAIVRAAGGSRELVDATGAGFVYETNDELQQRVRQLVADHALRIELGKKAREGYISLYTAARHLDQYLSTIATIQRRKGVKLHRA
ncbi:MAG: glycosyltransferase family 4 protein [Gammaproteobacteria bacterium]|nr:glycosyltransferase family 4 protein [Gammaproteobacteria bacterium]